ncbi:MAG: hypothetical protein HY010_19130 [Acidobacteria bacterium]|nr:hypothetical protein [Acidobacteriota bacterium]
MTPVALIFPSGGLALITLAGVAGGLYLFIRGFRLLARKRLLINTPTSKIRSASLGLVEVNGTATGPYTVPTPITGAPCFLYRTSAWQKNDESKSGDWKKVAEETLHVPFFLNDFTGHLLVEPNGAELDLRLDFRQNFSDTIFSPHATQPILSFLARHGVEPSNKIRIDECSIQPNSPLFMVGTIAENPGIEVRPLVSDVESQPRTRISLQPTTMPHEVVRLSETKPPSRSGDMTQQSKLAAALTKAGITNPAAWQAAGVPYQPAGNPQVHEVSVNRERTAPPTPADKNAFDLTPPVVLMKGTNSPAFLISWRSQNELVRSLAWKCAAMIWGGGALTLLGIYVLIQQMDLQ